MEPDSAVESGLPKQLRGRPRQDQLVQLSVRWFGKNNENPDAQGLVGKLLPMTYREGGGDGKWLQLVKRER